MFVGIGDYSEYEIQDLNHRYCGLRNKPKLLDIYFDKKCFSNKYENQTIFDVEIVEKRKYSTNNRIINGRRADRTESPWSVFISIRYQNESIGCTGVLLTFQWVLTTAHCNLLVLY